MQNNLRLQSKTALITGGTQSIGSAIAALFSEQGARVIITGRKAQAEGLQIAKNLGKNVSYLRLDVTKEKDWRFAMSAIREQYGKLDILVNNAGIEYPDNTESLQDPEHCLLTDWQAVHQVNLDGIFLGCKHAISIMKSNPDSAIVNIGSRSGLIGVPSSAAYSSSKAAILTKMWDKELGTDEKRSQRIAEFSQNIPLRRMGKPDDIAYAALYLASDESRFVTGTELIVDGGIMCGSSASPAAEVINVE